MAAWKNDEWYYCGVIYPDSDNAYLTEVANELLPEALEVAKAERARQCAILCEAPVNAEAVA